jgi:zinc protease
VVGFIDDREIASQVVLWATVQPGGDLRTVERTLDEEIRKLIATGPTAAELERVKVQSRAAFVRGIERIGGFGGKSDLLAMGAVFRGDPETYRKVQERIASATASDIRGAVKRWLTGGVYVLEVQPFPDYGEVASAVDRTKLPEIAPPPDAPLAAPERATLKNGMKVVLSRRSAVPVVRLSMLLEAGFAADDARLPGLSSMVMQMLDQGTTTRSAPQIADALAALGANLFAYADLDVSNVTVVALRDKLDAVLPIYADVLLHPVFPQRDLDRAKQNTLARIQQEEVQPFSMALRVLPALLYGAGHAYGQPLTGSGTPEAVKRMSSGDLAAFHQTWFKPNHATLVAVGDITMEELTAKLERTFAGWAPGEIPERNIAAVAEKPASEVYIMDRPGAEQSVILAGQLIAPKANSDEIAFQTFNDAFGGAFVSRVNMNLREDKHWSYGAGSFAVDARGQRLWMVYAPVQTDRTKEATQEVIKELHAVVSDRPLTAAEVNDARDRQTKTLAGRWETGASVSQALQEIVTFDLPDDFYTTFSQRVREVTDVQVNTAAQRFVAPDKVVWVVVGDRSKVEAGVRELHLGEVKLLAPEGPPEPGRP